MYVKGFCTLILSLSADTAKLRSKNSGLMSETLPDGLLPPSYSQKRQEEGTREPCGRLGDHNLNSLWA